MEEDAIFCLTKDAIFCLTKDGIPALYITYQEPITESFEEVLCSFLQLFT
jgi:hypothetical protein